MSVDSDGGDHVMARTPRRDASHAQALGLCSSVFAIIAAQPQSPRALINGRVGSWQRHSLQPLVNGTVARHRVQPASLGSQAGSVVSKRAAPPAPEQIEGLFLREARRYSLCDDDAWDAVAHCLEIAVRQRDRIRRETAVASFANVARHEEIRVRERRCREISLDGVNSEPVAEDTDADPEPDPRLPALRAAMQQLKADERRVLLLF